ncbi:MAG: methyltransferase domain-containing protein [Salinirussus sp.]
MNEEQRSAIRDAAKYLRQVRPLDPAELSEYVEDRPHPAAVAQELRESAVELGLRECSDGTFEPAPEGSVSLNIGRITGLPESAQRVLEDRLVDAYGPGWASGQAGDDLRRRIRDLKSRYLHGTPVEYDERTALAYAVYHLPQSYATAAYVLADLAADDLVPAQCRVLDVGAGVGGPALAVAEHLAPQGVVDYTALEPSPAAGFLETLLDATDPNFHLSVTRETVEAYDPTGDFDLILFSNVLSELDDPQGTVGRMLDSLTPTGTVVAIAPADRNTATALREIEREVEASHGATIYAPTVRLWPGLAPESTSWSFDVKPDLEVPAPQRRLDGGERTRSVDGEQPGDGTFENVDVRFAFSYLRLADERRHEFTPDSRRFARMRDADDHVTDRIDCVAIKLSHDLSSGKDANPLFLIGDGSQLIDHFAVRTAASTLNEDLLAASYGDMLVIENALVLWNDDEAAYNLVVDAETLVSRA